MASIKTLTGNPCLKWDVSRGSCQISLLGSRNHLTNHPNTDLNQMERVYWAYAPGLIGHGYGPDSGTEPWPRLRSHRDFKPQLHKHLHRGISLGTCACCTFILFLSDCGGGLVFSNIYILTCLPGCQPPTYTSLSDKERQFPGSSWEFKRYLTTTQRRSLSPNSFLVQVSLSRWGPSQEQLMKANTIKAYTQVQVLAYCV